jgi:hypothetical protein
VDVTITGNNDRPVITSAPQAASVTEMAERTVGENPSNHTSCGAITFWDVGARDLHAASFTAHGSVYLDTFGTAR